MIFSRRAKDLAFEGTAQSDEVPLHSVSTHSFQPDAIRADVPLTLMPLPPQSSNANIVNGTRQWDSANGAAANGAAANGVSADGAAQDSHQDHKTPVEEVSLRTLQAVEKSGGDIEAMREEVRSLNRALQNLSAQQGVQQSVFDTLHTELADYKNDFVGARMKPVITTMLFLYDTIEGFQKEVDGLIDPPDWLGDKVLSKKLVGGNLEHFNDQLGEAMLLCEMSAIEVETGEMADARTQRFVGAEPTDDPELDGRVQKVVRSGWKQGSRIFRPTEVVVWKIKS